MKKMDVYAYTRLSKEEKRQFLKEEGLLVEMEEAKGQSICLYYVCGFFVEVTYQDGEEVENMPYKRGFKVGNSNGVAA